MKSACAILSSVACLALQYLSTLFHEQYDFQEEEEEEEKKKKKKVIVHKTCVLIFSTTSV
jgi:1,4-dihydroxy-2-naphthoate octaprenyltransferase